MTFLLPPDIKGLTNIQSEVVTQRCHLQKKKKRDSNTSFSLWILGNFWEHFFLQNISGGYLCLILRGVLENVSKKPFGRSFSHNNDARNLLNFNELIWVNLMLIKVLSILRYLKNIDIKPIWYYLFQEVWKQFCFNNGRTSKNLKWFQTYLAKEKEGS